MRYYFSFTLFLIGLLYGSQSVLAEVYTSIPIEPYDEQSLQTISQSMNSLESDFGRVLNESINLQTAIETNKANPSKLNAANVTEVSGRMFYSCIEFTNNATQAITRVVPELKKYTKYLEEYVDKLEYEENTLYKESIRKIREEVKLLGQFVTDLDEIKKYFKIMQEDFRSINTVWVNAEQVNTELGKCFGSKNLNSFGRDMSRIIKQLKETRNMLINSVKENTVGSPNGYHESMNEMRREFKDYLRGG